MADYMKDDIDAHLMHKLKEIVPEVIPSISSYADKSRKVFAIEYRHSSSKPKNKRRENLMTITNSRSKIKLRRIILHSNNSYQV